MGGQRNDIIDIILKLAAWVIGLSLLALFLYFMHWSFAPCRSMNLTAAEERACLIAAGRQIRYR